MNRHSQPGLGALEPTQSHSTHSHTHRVTHVQSHVTSFRALDLTNPGTLTYSPEPPQWMGHDRSLESHADLDTHQADTLVPHAHAQAADTWGGVEGCPVVAVPGLLAPPPSPAASSPKARKVLRKGTWCHCLPGHCTTGPFRPRGFCGWGEAGER